MILNQKYPLAIIIPCWNCANFIEDLLDCLLQQSFSNWKAFLIDDGCQDSTASIIKNYSGRDSRINYFMRDVLPKGAPTCRNIGIKLSEGAEFIIFLDSDDLVSPFCFEQRVCFMRNQPNVDFASFPMKAFKTSIFDSTFWGFGVPGRQELLLSFLSWKTLQIVVPSNIYRREKLIQVDLRWDENLQSMQDADFNIQALIRGLKHSFDDKGRIDYFYRQGQQTVSKRISDPSMLKSHLYLIEKEINSIRHTFHAKYDFYLKAYIVNYFDLFKNNIESYKSLLAFQFVKSHFFFFLRIAIFLTLGLRGKRILFRPYLDYTQEEVKQWHQIISSQIKEKTEQETNEWIYAKS